MAYRVRVYSRAARDFSSLFDEINAEHSEFAFKWYQGLKLAILSLEENPNRCPFARKKYGLRHLLYVHKPHIYRVIFRVLEKQKIVEVIHLRHGARRKFNASDFV